MNKEKLKLIEYQLAKENYADYVQLVHDGVWVKSRFGQFLCDEIQNFIEAKTGHPYDILILSVPPQTGKALEVHTPILTTKGWKMHGELTAGDYVYNQNGKAVKVLATQTPYLHHCQRVTLDTGDEFICAREHEWVIEKCFEKQINNKRVRGRKTVICETQNIFDGKYQHRNPAIHIAKPIDGNDIQLPIDPYLYGAWLGDGSSIDSVLSCGSDDLGNMLENLKNFPVSVKKDSRGKNYIIRVGKTTGKKNSNKFRTALRENNLIQNKHILPVYFIASERQRRELLKGLMDTDGFVGKSSGTCEYCGTNKTLCEDVFRLVRTLGYKAKISAGLATLNGVTVGKKYRVTFTVSKGESVFNLRRKQKRIDNKVSKDRSDKERYFITSVEDVEPHFVSCITVEGGIYLAGNMVQTHNSMTVTATLPSWFMGKNPMNKVIEISYNTDYARQFGRQNREKIREYGSKVFGIDVASRPSGELEFELTNHVGSMISRGVDAGVTGRGCNLMIIDDPIKNRKEADSETTRNRLWNEWTDSYRTRLAPGAKVILIMTRWHMDDLAGRIIDKENHVRVLNLPCEAEENDPMGREVGEPLHPEIGKGKRWLKTFKNGVIKSEGMRTWEAMYQGHPTVEEGNMVHREWWQYYTSLPKQRLTIMSVDATFKDSDRADFVAIQVWAKSEADYFLVDRVKARMDFVSTVNRIKYLKGKYPEISGILVEDKANGAAIMSILKSQIPGIIGVDPAGGKIARVNAVSPAIESGNVYLPEGKEWTQEFVEEFAAFPHGAHDDEVDCCSQALNRLIYTYTHYEAPKEEDMDLLVGRKTPIFGIPANITGLFQ